MKKQIESRFVARLQKVFADVEEYPDMIPSRAQKRDINFFTLHANVQKKDPDLVVEKLMHQVNTEVRPRVKSTRCCYGEIWVSEPSKEDNYYSVITWLYFKEKGENTECLESALFYEIVERYMRQQFGDPDEFTKGYDRPREKPKFVFATRATDSSLHWQQLFTRWLLEKGPKQDQFPPYGWEIVRVAVTRHEPQSNERILYVEIDLV